MAKINIFCKASLMHGMGHLIRQIRIAEEIRDHNDISFYLPDFPAAANIIKQHEFSFSIVENFGPAKADITILDIQDTTHNFIQELKQQSKKIISFEPTKTAYHKIIKSSQHDNFWVIHPRAAIGDKIGKTAINVAGNNGQSSSILKYADKLFKRPLFEEAMSPTEKAMR